MAVRSTRGTYVELKFRDLNDEARLNSNHNVRKVWRAKDERKTVPTRKDAKVAEGSESLGQEEFKGETSHGQIVYSITCILCATDFNPPFLQLCFLDPLALLSQHQCTPTSRHWIELWGSSTLVKKAKQIHVIYSINLTSALFSYSWNQSQGSTWSLTNCLLGSATVEGQGKLHRKPHFANCKTQKVCTAGMAMLFLGKDDM